MEKLILSTMTIDQLKDEILSGVSKLLENNRNFSKSEKQNWTTKETAEFCKVSKVTIHQWTKKGILKKYKIGNRVFYKKNEVLRSINQMEY